MKELSIEEKARRYDKAINTIRNLVKAGLIYEDAAIQVFPELKESEDEKIRRFLIDFIEVCKWTEKEEQGWPLKEECLAWLEKQDNINPTEDELEALRIAAYEPTKNWSEKLQSLYEKLTNCEQGEQKPVFEMKTPEESLSIDSDTYNKIVDECIYGEQKPTDVEEVNFFDDFRKTDSEVEPKFHEGEWITNGDYTWQIVEIKPLDYILQSQDGNVVDDTISHVDEQFHSFTIQDAKAGDVFVNQNGEMPFIFKECKNNHIYCYCGYTNRKDIFFDRFVDSEGEELHWLNLYHEQVYPATKEQRDLLFSKMKEAEYEWDTDKKELKKIEQKPAWSEEDERTYESVLYAFKHNYPLNSEQQKFIKSLKYRVQPQQEWSKEDEGYYDAIIAKLEVTREDALLTDNEMDFLKSLEGRVLPKSTWNEEDITKLKSAITLLQNPLIACDEVNDGVRIKTVDWLKSIENKVLLQSKQEWSEKDKHMLQKVIDFMNHPDLIKATPTLSKSTIDWLKFLEEKYTWKPSEEQMTQLKKYCPDNRPLTLLYEQLKKLINEK